MRLGRDGWERATAYRRMMKDAAHSWLCVFLPTAEPPHLVYYSQPVTEGLAPYVWNEDIGERHQALAAYAVVAQGGYKPEEAEWPGR